jgi:hypothetical protein
MKKLREKYRFLKQQNLQNNREETGKNILTGSALEGIKNDLKILTKEKRKFGKTSELLEGFSFVISVAGVNRPS